jgi:hypothetical protein
MGKRKHVVNLMFTVTLLGVFALTALLVAMMGAQVYSHSADKMQDNFDTRTSLVYLSEKIRQYPGNDLSITEVYGNQALCLAREADGIQYETWIYVYEDGLYEANVPTGTVIMPGEHGQWLMALKAMDITYSDKLLTIFVESQNGEKNSICISSRTSEDMVR